MERPHSHADFTAKLKQNTARRNEVHYTGSMDDQQIEQFTVSLVLSPAIHYEIIAKSI